MVGGGCVEHLRATEPKEEAAYDAQTESLHQRSVGRGHRQEHGNDRLEAGWSYFVETTCSKALRTTVTEMGWLSGEHAPATPPRTEDPARTHRQNTQRRFLNFLKDCAYHLTKLCPCRKRLMNVCCTGRKCCWQGIFSSSFQGCL